MDSIFRGATYTWERLIGEYIRYMRQDKGKNHHRNGSAQEGLVTRNKHMRKHIMLILSGKT